MADDADNEHEQEEATTTRAEDSSNKKKRQRHSKNLTISQFSCRHPTWSYLHLRHISSVPVKATIDETTVSLWLDAALTQFLGLHGRAIPVDLLKLNEQDIHIRIPDPDRQAFVAALSTWTGRNGDALRIVGWSSWDANAFGHDAGQDLFTD